jgi:hypothetical protein
LGDLKDMEQETSKRLNVWKTLGRKSKARKAIISLYKMHYVVFASPFNHQHTYCPWQFSRKKICRK